MEIFQRFALVLTIVMLGLWGITLILLPDAVSGLLSEEPVNHAFAGMMGAALLGLAFISFASITRWISAPRALGFAVLFLVVESAYLMLGAGTMLVTAPTSMSLVSAATVAFFLLIQITPSS
uniref:Uncharacterized protein n=1 Tax=Candidatus Kentrum eta TaxID=2126337 RepID=A0A450VFQ8_9GAMM|nr:MAG: hypothetical protein BECKH772A_GA0070896_101394 [Candidatus Kentron sp. H]VFJ98610.1 MAG: hypothetical protein BECKH772B_GA0070898_101384 [Candidatus Kentron sp. H]VFK03626.1 MAG: hypothetical protein BECKH772C_GA0070978_101384 [Candidatus Kentron sp. H]